VRIKSMKEVKIISVLLVAFTALLTCKEANSLPSGSSYVLPPSAPSNWIINPANPIYSPRGLRNTPDSSSSQVSFTRNQIRRMTKDMKESGMWETEFYEMICSRQAPINLQDHELSSVELSVLREEAGCR
jgi:hypothetical protein